MVLAASADGEARSPRARGGAHRARARRQRRRPAPSRCATSTRDRSGRAQDARKLAERWRRIAGGADAPLDLERAGVLLALAYPDRIAKSRDGRSGEFQLANGRGVALEPTDALAREPWLAVAELAGRHRARASCWPRR